MDHMNRSVGKTIKTEVTHPLKPFRERYINYLLEGDRTKANALVQELLLSNVLLEDIYMEIFHESQREIGKLWQANRITIGEEHFCTAATQLIMGQLYPRIFATPKNDLVFVGTCVSGELHELGVRMVSDLIEFSGWNTYYLGANTPIKSIVETIVKKRANVVGISVTMSYHIDEVARLIEKIKSDAQCSNVKIMVGGYPFIVEDQLWKVIGADGFALNARDAVTVANKLSTGIYLSGVHKDDQYTIIMDTHIEALSHLDEISKLNNELLNSQRELAKKNQLLNTLNSELERMATRDPLTGLYNRRLLVEKFQDETRRASRLNYPLSVAVIDINHFKKVNDQLGHSEGDVLLVNLAKLIRKLTRASLDIAFRIGGDEFLLLLTNCDKENAELTIQRLNEAFKTFSEIASLAYGVVELDVNIELDLDRIIMEADQLMFENKQGSR